MFIPENYAQVNLRFGGSGLPTGAEVTFGVLHEESGLSPADVGNAVKTAWNDNVRDASPIHTTLQSILVKFGPNATGPAAEVAVGLAGTNSNADVNPAVAVLVQKHTPVGGRKGRGRFYWPLATETEMADGGSLTSSAVAGIQTAMDDFLAALDTASIGMAVLHNDGATVPYQVTSLGVSPTLATQRKRLRR